METELTTKIKTWLLEQGFPFEMHVASVLVKSDFQVIQSKIFNDPETGVKREIDIVATLQDTSGFLSINFVIECKKTSSPWIVFSSKDTLSTYNYHHTFGFRTKYARKLFLKHDNDDFEAMRKEIPWYWNYDKRIGYSAIQAFTQGKDSSFVAQMSALKASYSLRNDEDKGTVDMISIYFPIVLLEGDLFEAYLNEKGELTVAPSDRLFLQNPYYQEILEGVNIQVITRSGLDRFIFESKKLLTVLNTRFQSDIDSMYR